MTVSLTILCFIMLGSPKLFATAEIQGQTAIFASTMPNFNSPNLSRESGGAELNLTTAIRWDQYWRVQFSPEIKADALTKDPSEQFVFEPKELNLERKKLSQKLKVGFSRVNWEGTDLVNPMDIVHAKNYRDPLNSTSRSSAGIFYSDQIKSVSWDLIYIPLQSKALFPGESSPWWPRSLNLPVENDNLVLLLPNQVDYHVTSDEVLNHALDNNVGLRVQYHGDSWDLSLAGFDGSSSPPLLIPIVTTTAIEVYPRQIFQLQNPVLIRPTYYRHRVAAMATAVTTGTWIFRFSAQHAQPQGDSSFIPGWSEYAVLGGEKTLPLWKRDITLLAQILSSRRAESSGLSALSGLLEKSVMLGWRWAFAEKWTWTSALFQEQTTFSTFTHSELSWSWRDNWRQDLVVDLFSGPADSAIGAYDRNDRVLIKTNYLF